MQRSMLKSKIHRAIVTHALVDYEGSIEIDQDLLDAADIIHYEEVNIWDVTNGARFATYAIPAPRGSGRICINGAAARLVSPGDCVIIASFFMLDEEECARHVPKLVFVDEKNRIKSIGPHKAQLSSVS
jgi:aspartate 1-decarboxylase